MANSTYYTKKNKVSAAAKVANLSWQKAVINSRRGRLNYRTMMQNEDKRNRKLAKARKTNTQKRFNQYDKNNNNSISFKEFKNFQNS